LVQFPVFSSEKTGNPLEVWFPPLFGKKPNYFPFFFEGFPYLFLSFVSVIVPCV
jgi:hypothetical protein